MKEKLIAKMKVDTLCSDRLAGIRISMSKRHVGLTGKTEKILIKKGEIIFAILVTVKGTC